MATTKIWKVKGRLDHVLDYAGDDGKTANPDYKADELQGLRDVMDYTCQDYKTEKQHYVSGINCEPDTARRDMIATKQQYGKPGGIIAFHGYQSFAYGEVTPELAHEIGMKLAGEMWGERFEVLVATHLDKKHIHNHFVLNSVSFKDGYKYYSNLENTDRFRIKSDRLCAEHNLSVIRNPQKGRRPSYAVYLAEQNGEPTYRALVRADVDRAISEALTDKQFFQNLRKMGYEIKIGKDITVRPQGKDRGLKLFRNFGEDYTRDTINLRILCQGTPRRARPESDPQMKKMRVRGNFQNTRRLTGFRALYFRYFYLLSGRPQRQIRGQRPLNNKQILFIFREDIRKMQGLKNEMKLLGGNRIDSAEQLSWYKDAVTAQMEVLAEQRQGLRYKARKTKDETALAGIKAEISGLSAQLGALRRDVKLCDSVTARTAVMTQKIKQAAAIRENEQKQKIQRKEQRAYEPFRRRR